MGSPRRVGSGGWAGTLGLSCPPPYQGQLCSGGLAWTLPWGLELQFSTGPLGCSRGLVLESCGGKPRSREGPAPAAAPPLATSHTTQFLSSAHGTPPRTAPTSSFPIPLHSSPLSPAARLLGTWSESFL